MTNTPEEMADEFMSLIRQRLDLQPDEEVVCPRERSTMTPCIGRDGHLAVASGGVCVGCEFRVVSLLEKERAKHK